MWPPGLELGLNDLLAGEPGQARLIKRAGSSEDLGEVVLRRARHGQERGPHPGR
jgi:hypothetical protein